jgi:GIY-YIG catalytic domain
MGKIATAIFKGKSGENYSFNVYASEGTTFKKDIGGVYIFTKRTVRDGKGSHSLLYIGETNSFGTRIPSHEKWSCVNKKNVNCICILRQDDEEERKAIETDLIQANSPPCNKEDK